MNGRYTIHAMAIVRLAPMSVISPEIKDIPAPTILPKNGMTLATIGNTPTVIRSPINIRIVPTNLKIHVITRFPDSAPSNISLAV